MLFDRITAVIVQALASEIDYQFRKAIICMVNIIFHL